MTKSVCVTGGASFIGSHLTEQLVNKNYEVQVIDDLSSGKKEFLKNCYDKIKFHNFDIRNDTKRLYQIFKECDTIFHLANIHGGRNFIHFHPALCCNNMAIDNLVFEIAVKTGVKHTQFCSSACVYPLSYQAQNDYNLLKEEFVDYENLRSADEEYGLAKLMGEVSLRAHNREFGINGSITRLSSIYGPRENETHAVVALIAKAFVKQDPYEIFGDGTQLRNFTYVDDVVECMIRASEKINDCTPVNIGTEEFISINDLVKIIFAHMKWQPSEINHDLSKPTGAHSRIVSNKRTSDLLGFHKEDWTPIEQGIKKTIDWYVSTHDKNQVEDKLEILLKER